MNWFFLGIHLSSVRKRLSVTPKISSSLEPNRRKSSKQLEKEFIQKDVYNPYKIRDSYLSKCLLKTWIPRDYIAIKITLDNYDGLTDPREHVENIRNTVELIIHDNHFICKILLTTFRGSVRAWYNNPKSDLVISFNNLCIKLVACFSTSILARNSSTELFGITEVKDEFLRVYLKHSTRKCLRLKSWLNL